MVRLEIHVLLTDVNHDQWEGFCLHVGVSTNQTCFLKSANQDLLNKECFNAAKHAASVLLQCHKLDQMKVTFIT